MLPARVFKTEGLGENTKPAASGAALGRAALLPLTGEETLEVFGSLLSCSNCGSTGPRELPAGSQPS